MTQNAPDTEGGSTTEQVKEQVGEKAQMAQDKVRGAAGETRGGLADQFTRRSTQAVERLSGTAADVRSVAEELRRQGKDTPARLAEQAAGQTDRVADFLKGASGERLLRNVEDFARGKPWAVAAGGLVLGFAASRFLKASSSRRYQTGQTSYPTYEEAEVGRYPVAEPPAAAVAGVPVVGTYDPAAPTVTTRAPAGAVPTDPDLRAPRA